jgi:hypothetical protein
MDINTLKEANEQQLMKIEGVEGVGIGVDAIGNPTIVVYISNAAAQKLLPKRIEGVEVRVENLKGPIEALPHSRSLPKGRARY